MGRLTQMALPRLGETMEEGRITAWLKQPGEAFKRGETLLECETDKTVVEVPALTDGILRAHLANAGDRVPVDGAIADIEVEGDAPAPGARASSPPASAAPTTVIPVIRTLTAAPPSQRRASPAARRLARRHGVALDTLAGTGRNGRVMVQDLALPVTDAPGLTIWPAAGPQRATVFLIHGLFADAASFTSLGRALARAGLAAAAADLPGHGESRSEARSLDEIAAGIGELIAQTTRGPLVLLAHSYGALIAAKLAQRFAPRLQRLVLIAPAGFGTEIGDGFLSGMLEANDTASIQTILAQLGGGPVSGPVAELTMARIAERREQLAAMILEFQDGGWQSQSILDAIAGLKIPVSAIFGRDDTIIPAHHAINAPRNVDVRFTASGGHVPHWADPAFIASLV